MRSVAAGPALVRVVALVAGVTLMLAPARLNLVATAIVGAGLVGGLIWSDRVGAGPSSAGFVLAWIAASGWHGDPSLVRTAVAAAALYVFHAAVALAAVVPLTARLDPTVLRRFGRRSALVIAVSALVIAADYAIAPRRGAPVVELLGLLAALAVVAVPVRRALR